VPVECAEVDRPDLAAGRAGEAQPRKSRCNRCAYRRVEPQGPAAGLTRVPDGHDLLRVDDGLALGFGTGGLRCSSGGCSLSFLAIVTHPIDNAKLGMYSALKRLCQVGTPIPLARWAACEPEESHRASRSPGSQPGGKTAENTYHAEP
jgi:hypothetical protein